MSFPVEVDLGACSGMGLSEFKKISTLGKGSYGSVYKVQRRSDKKVYALKEVSIKPLKQREREEAVNEIRILASLHHKSIIRYKEAFVERDNIYIVTEYARGGDLHSKIKEALHTNKSIPEKTVWHYFVQICRGVEVLHANKILHRDLKPKNIFLTAGNVVKIGDLGCSKLTKGQLSKTQVGTPYYMCPEIWKRQPYNEKSDVWSLGCILFELVALGPPFLADSIEDLSKKICTSQVPSRKIRLGYSGEPTKVINWLMQKSPTDRPTTEAILHSSCIKTLMEKLQESGKGVQMTPMAERKGELKLLQTIKVPSNCLARGLKLPANAYHPIAALQEKSQGQSLSLPKVTQNAQHADKENAGPLRTNANGCASKKYNNRASVQPKYSRAANLPTQADGQPRRIKKPTRPLHSHQNRMGVK